MKLCDLALGTPEENLACDEALLEICENGGEPGILRFWETPRYFVVVGYANKVATEVNLDFCQHNSVPVLRRSSGGGAVLQGPGCLNYSLVLRLDSDPRLATITGANTCILERHRDALAEVLHAPVRLEGHTDLSIGGLKFSGNSQRRRNQALLFHGTILLRLDTGMVEKTLRAPSKQPAYRAGRSHFDFITNLKVPPQLIKTSLAAAWNAVEPLQDFPTSRTAALARERYGLDEWNLKF
jgi:lipoate-protein ligase A